MLTVWKRWEGKECLNITNINLLIRFIDRREMFPSFTQVLSITLTATPSGKTDFPVRVRLPATRRGELSAVITQLIPAKQVEMATRKWTCEIKKKY